MNGVLVIDKPSGMTSHDVVNRVRRTLEQRAVGHLGTLDPSATGVLPLVIGKFTRLAQFYTSSEKTYEGAIRFGFSTNTYDADGEPTSSLQQAVLSLDQLQEVARHFVGRLEQVPPPFSAKKIHGVPAYKLARKNKPVPLKPVEVEIKEFAILDCEGDGARFRARVASGTYMRSVAHDMGQKLGCGAHLQTLRRTLVGEFRLAQACSLEELKVAAEKGRVEDKLVHPRELLPQFPSVTASEEAAVRIRRGQTINLMELSHSRQVKVFCGQKELIAIATRIAGTLFHPGIVLAGDPARQPESSRHRL